MPHPIVYYGNQDDDQARAVDVVHIEPSIREGVHLVSSLYGPDASAPLYRYAPINLFPPYITGNAQIPNILTCNSGQWDASPAVILYFQWMADGADIPGATGQTWLSTVEYDNTVITCEVRGWNNISEQYVLTSNSVSISLIEPIELNELESYWVSGISASKHITMQDDKLVIASGMAALGRLDVNRGVTYFTTGMAADTREDINCMRDHFISGISQAQTLSVLERDYSIAVISRNIGVPLVDGEPQIMSLKNPQAEMGIAGWERFGAVGYETTHKHAGAYSWNGGDDVDPANLNIPYSYIYQDVPIFIPHEVDVDAGSTTLELEWFQYSIAGQDQANARVEFYNGTGNMLGFDSGPGLWASPSGIFFLRTADISIPPNTRSVRLFLEFNLQQGTDNNGQIDSVKMSIRKGAKVVSRSYGPDFRMWRLKFMSSNTWSGGGLSELEFRQVPGGVDLTDSAGGAPIFGSAGLGITNADAAFDNQRNTGYWAGAENSIAEGTSWIGYDLGVGNTAQPKAIEITARPGSDALQVPRSFFVEGSDDGIQWTKVHWVDETLHGPAYNTGERREIIIPTGNFDFFRNHPDIGSPNYVRYSSFSDDYPGKGLIYYCHSRINITHLSACTQYQDVSYNYRLQLARLNMQKSGSYGPGMITEVLEDHSLISPAGGNTGPGWTSIWRNHALDTTHEFEVGDYFLIRFFDLDAASNALDPNEGRLAIIENWNGPSQFELLRVAQTVDTWNGNTVDLSIGDTNPNPSFPKQDFLWGLDFKGNVF